MSSYTFIDNSPEVLQALEEAKKRGLKAIGMAGEGYAKDVLSETVYTGKKPWPLTGRLRNSITYATANEHGIGEDPATPPDYTPRGTPEEDAVYIGTNVEYAAGIELGTHRRAGAVHFLQRAAMEHGEEYKAIMEDSLRNA